MVDGRTPTLAEMIGNAATARGQGTWTAMPGIVQAYDRSSKTADVQIALKQPVALDDGTFEYRDTGTLSAVPVVFPSGGGYSLAFPLIKGDGVLLVFTMYPHDAWRQAGQVAEPGDTRLHHPAGAVALPGFLNVAQSAANGGGPAHLVLGKDGAEAIHIDTLIRLGSASASDFVALSSKVDAIFSLIKATVHPPAGPLGTTGDALATALNIAIGDPAWASVAATKATAE